MTDIEQTWWQTLIHDLSPNERQEVVLAMRRQIGELRSLSQPSMPEHLRQRLTALEAFVSGELN